ncbi:glucan biosynthesis protein [Coraliomargarita algicola]|uniref:Glucan biosynthesis protein n=1 Tax=Coraliomargarita algicola TaxID=3092156 RepID=A0ABZ0RPV6_9BACT|nr:glucan biosynthesis protein [Coraliomargarita sp. J2-16]WPJ97183.1 glucan biosynthesis protein [Coraliomargarita sp. J2-16]
MIKINRSLLVFCALSTLQAQQERNQITLDAVASEARALIEQPARTPEALPQELQSLNYDQYREIRFRPSEALWWNTDSKFRVEFFHPGHLFNDQVKIYEASDTHAQEIPFMKNAFDYGNSGYDPGFFTKPKAYSGIRVKYPVNKQDVYDELIVFLGSSYFRALGAGQDFGLSLRGLSMNTIGDQEDFPRFTKLWLKKPQADSKRLTVFALLEGEKVTGAYRFDIRPQGITQIDVHARLFFRDGGASEVGIAPLTSMFVHGENSNRTSITDWRPEVHDSDGMLVHANNEWTWFPIENLPGQTIQRLPTAKLRGFGLLQRDRDFRNYKDLEANYQRRPSAWIEPIGKWSTGEVVLYTFGTDTEATDNVTAFWKPDIDASIQDSAEFAYRITLQTKDPTHELAKVLETRVGQRTLDSTARTVIIEFSRPESIELDEIDGLSVGFEYGGAEAIEAPIIQYNEPEDRIRVFANFKTAQGRQPESPYKMSAQLLREGHQVSERWNYTWKH